MRAATDASAGFWIRPALGEFGTIDGLVPRFEATARIVHPGAAQQLAWVDDEPAGEPERLRWRELAAEQGTTMHPLAQWQALLGAYRPPEYGEDGWQVSDPEQGAMEAGEFVEVARVLARHGAAKWHLALWEGAADTVAPSRYRSTPEASPAKAERRPLAPLFATAARLSLPNREFLLVDAEAAELLTSTWREDVGWVGAHERPLPPPNLLWPDDASWLLHTEVDLDSTFVTGPRALIDELLALDAIEALEFTDEHRRGWGADPVNLYPGV